MCQDSEDYLGEKSDVAFLLTVGFAHEQQWSIIIGLQSCTRYEEKYQVWFL